MKLFDIFKWGKKPTPDDDPTVVIDDGDGNEGRRIVNGNDGSEYLAHTGDAVNGSGRKNENDTGITSLPAGVKIVGMKFHSWTTAMEPYYIIKSENGGYNAYISWDDIAWEEIDGENGTDGGRGWGKTSCVFVDEKEADMFFNELVDLGVIGWDGYNKSKGLGRDVLDGDNGFNIKFLLSDGRVVKAHGYNVHPARYKEVQGKIFEFFDEHQDYSSYYPKELPDAKISRFLMSIGSSPVPKFNLFLRIELNRGWKRWSIILQDPKNEYVEESSQISEYADTEEELPFEIFANLLKKYDFVKYNRTNEQELRDNTHEYFRGNISFEEDEREYDVSMNLDKSEYDAFIREMVDEIKKYYRQIKSS